MKEGSRRLDNGSVDNPYGSQSICRGCKWGKAQLRVDHRARDPFDNQPEPGQEAGPVRLYCYYVTCTHRTFMTVVNGIAVFPEMHDVVECDTFQEKGKDNGEREGN